MALPSGIPPPQNPDPQVPVFAPAMMQSAFTIDAFDRHRMKWSRWVERLEGAFVLFGVRDDTKLFMLLHFMGSETYDTVCDKLAPAKPQTKTYAEIVRLLEAHFNPEPLEILENFRFKCRKQGDDRPEETIDDYLIALRKLAITCNFGNYLDTALRNQLVFGLKDRVIQSRLLEVRNLTLDRAREIAVSMELSSKGGREIQLRQGKSEINLVEPTRSVRGNTPAKTKVTNANYDKKNKEKLGSGKKGQCYRCGSASHFANKCPHIRTVCHYCKMVGHLQKVCLKAKKEKGTKSEAHLLEDAAAETRREKGEMMTLEEICKLDEIPKPSTTKFYLELVVNSAAVRFEVDTGAPVTIISTEDKKRYFPAEKLLPSDLELVSYCNNRINVEGMLNVTTEYRSESFELPLYVSNVRKQPLLGRQWITGMQIDLNNVAHSDVHVLDGPAAVSKCTPAAVRALVEKYANVYDNSIGRITGFQAKLSLKPNATPVYVKARTVPFSLKEVVERELDTLVESGVLEKVNHSAWATPIVPIMKSNNRVRLCGDFKVTVNPKLEVDDHPLPTVEELFATVAGGEKFTKIDLTQAYLQLEVEEGDREILTLSTHKGLYRPTRLMYGIASAPAIWQRFIEQVLDGIPGVTVFLDDIRITGPNDFIHMQRQDRKSVV